MPLRRPDGDAQLPSPEFDLPVGVPASRPNEVHTRAPFSVLAKRLLIVEDEPLVALDLSKGLRDLGAIVVASVGTADSALELIESKKLDAALLDGNLRGSPIDQIAAALTRHGVPFRFVTATREKNFHKHSGRRLCCPKNSDGSNCSDAVGRLFVPTGDIAPFGREIAL